MIIAVASDDGMHVAEHPGRCRGFVVFEVGPSRAVRVGYRSNTCIQGRTRESLAAGLSDCGALLSQRVDDALIRELQGSDIDVYACAEDSVDRAAELFRQGRLRKLDAVSRLEG